GPCDPRAPFSSSKRSRGCRAGAWQRRIGHVPGMWLSSLSRPRDRTAFSRVTRPDRFCGLGIRRSSTTRTTRNSPRGYAAFLHCVLPKPFHTISSMTFTCPSCGNNHNFLVKTLQMHIVRLDDARVEVNEEGRQAVMEVLCDECETALNFEDFDETVRKEMLLTLGAR